MTPKPLMKPYTQTLNPKTQEFYEGEAVLTCEEPLDGLRWPEPPGADAVPRGGGFGFLERGGLSRLKHCKGAFVTYYFKVFLLVQILYSLGWAKETRALRFVGSLKACGSYDGVL